MSEPIFRRNADGTVTRTRLPLLIALSGRAFRRHGAAFHGAAKFRAAERAVRREFPIPAIYRCVGPTVGYDTYDFAPWGLHWAIRVWRARYHVWYALMTLGVWEVDEGDYLNEGRVRWDFWNNPQSWWKARKYAGSF